MQDQLISFETAKLAKEKGFNIKTINGAYNDLDRRVSETPMDWNNHLSWVSEDRWGYKGHNANSFYSIPTQTTLHKWMRENYRINIHILSSNVGWHYSFKFYVNAVCKETYNSYEEALEEGLKQALNLIPNG